VLFQKTRDADQSIAKKEEGVVETLSTERHKSSNTSGSLTHSTENRNQEEKVPETKISLSPRKNASVSTPIADKENMTTVKEKNNVTSTYTSPVLTVPEDRIRGTKVAKNMNGRVIVGQVDFYNPQTQMYLCSFENGKKVILLEEAFQQAVYVCFVKILS
jgi:hypothetical protein